MLLLGLEGNLPAGTACCTQVREQLLLTVLVTLDTSFKLGSNYVYLMRVGVREGGTQTLGHSCYKRVGSESFLLLLGREWARTESEKPFSLDILVWLTLQTVMPRRLSP